MPLALPDGYVDTGRGGSVSMSGQMRVRMVAPAAGGTVPPENPGDDATTFIDAQLGAVQFTSATINDFEVSGWRTSDSFEWTAAILRWPGGNPVTLEFNPGPIDSPTQYSDWYTYEETYSGLRLGRRRLLDPDLTATPQPVFDQLHMVEKYNWFGDRNTSRSCQVGAHQVTLYLQSGGGWNPVQEASDFTPLDMGALIGPLSFSALVNQAESAPDVEFQGLTYGGGSVDTTGLSNGVVTGAGGGAAGSSGNGSGGGQAFAPTRIRREFRPTLYYRGEADYEDANGEGSEPFLGAITFPYDDEDFLTYQNNTWTATPVPTEVGPVTVSRIRWNGELVDHPAADATAGLWVQPALSSPGTWPAFFTPVTVRFENSPLAEDSTFTAIANGYRHTLGEAGTDLPEWRRWLGQGTLGKADPSFNPDLADRSKSSGVPWWWGGYGYLRFEGILGPAEQTSNFARLLIYGVHRQITDNHETGSSRGNEFTVVETPYVTETIVNIGQHDQPFDKPIDLLMPHKVNGEDVSGAERQFHHGCIDRYEFLGYPEGQPFQASAKITTLLARTECYLKLGYGPPSQRGDYSSASLANGGSNAVLLLGDSEQKAPEDQAEIPNTTGGHLRYVRILTGSGTGLVLDEQLTLAEMVNLLHGLQGLTATYDAATHATANEDAYGTSLSAPSAQCLVPLVPDAQFARNENYQPPCVWLANRVELVNGVDFHLGTRHCVGSAIAGLVGANGSTGRASQSVTMAATGYPSSARACDAWGYCRAYPVGPSSTTPAGLVQVQT